MEGLSIGIEEIVYLSLVAFTLLSIGIGIFAVADSDRMMAKAAAYETSYITTLATNNNIDIEFKYDDMQLEEDNNKIRVNYNKATYEKNYFGKSVSIKQKDQNTFIITNG